MHESVKRLMEYAREATAGEPRPVASFGDLGFRMGKSSAVLTNWKARGVSKQGAIEAEAMFGCSVTWILTGEGPRDSSQRVSAPKSPTVASAPIETHRLRNVRTIWVVGNTQGGLPERIWDDADHPVGVTDSYTEAASTDPHAFAVRVVGDSMSPRYQPGEYALVEPGVVPDLEDDVLVRLRTGETMLKILLSRRGGVRLGSHNRAVETMNFREDEITWMYYVAHPIPARRIKQRIDLQSDHELESFPDRDFAPTTLPAPLESEISEQPQRSGVVLPMSGAPVPQRMGDRKKTAPFVLTKQEAKAQEPLGDRKKDAPFVWGKPASKTAKKATEKKGR